MRKKPRNTFSWITKEKNCGGEIMGPVHVLLLAGGGWHDFNGFAETVKKILAPHGFRVDFTFDPDRLLRLEQEKYQLVISYTCFVGPGEKTPVTGVNKLNAQQVETLTGWVRNGGSFLAAHAATVFGQSPSGLRQLIGGAFLSHPEPFVFTVYPLLEKHPITKGLQAFSIYDELYREEHDPSVHLHMITVDRGVAYPLVWSKPEGNGKVAHIALGHDHEAWENPSYQQLMRQTIFWLTGYADS